MKRIFDFFLATFGIFLSSPLWVLFGWGIWLNDFGPVFFIQARVGKDGIIFKNIQFRSMVRDAERDCGPLQARERDPRITRLGKILRATAMDELPQLLNIALGQMSFVGPRALRPVEIDADELTPRSIWDFDGAKERSLVRPGLTGIAQILAPRNVSRGEKFKLDLWYIKNINFSLDIYIIFISFLITFSGMWERSNRNIDSLISPLRLLTNAPGIL